MREYIVKNTLAKLFVLLSVRRFDSQDLHTRILITAFFLSFVLSAYFFTLSLGMNYELWITKHPCL